MRMMTEAKEDRRRISSARRPPEIFGKVPPQSIELEEVVLGSILLDGKSITKVSFLLPNHFYQQSHQHIFESVLDLFSQNITIDLLSVSNQLKKKGSHELVGGSSYLATLTTRISQSSNIESYGRMLLEYFIKREIIAELSYYVNKAYEEESDCFQLLSDSSKSIFKMFEITQKRQAKRMSELCAERANFHMTRERGNNSITGVPSGFWAVDGLTAGFQDSDLIVVASRPGMGKTGLLCALAENAKQANISSAFFSIEMASYQLADRMISSTTEIEFSKLKSASMDDFDIKRLVSKTINLVDKNIESQIYVDDTPGLDILELKAKLIRLVIEHNVKIAFIDFLQLIRVTSKFENRNQEVSYIAKELKSIAKELNIPIVVISSLSRGPESRPDKRPQLSDLRESGDIESNADLVIFLYRDEYYKIMQDSDGNSTEGVAELNFAKHRNGPMDTVKIRFMGKYQKFTDLSTF